MKNFNDNFSNYGLTKKQINNLVGVIAGILAKHGLLSDCSFYFNGKRIHYTPKVKPDGSGDIYHDIEVLQEANPLDYFDYANKKHILSIATEGPLYDKLYSGEGFPRELEDLFDQLHLYYEMGDSWNLSFYPIDDEQYDYIEFTDYRTDDEIVMETATPADNYPIYLFHGGNPGEPFQSIMDEWFELSEQVGDVGSCVIGAGFSFEYQGKKYEMSACSPWQGSISWEMHKDVIQKRLEEIGCTNIRYNWGHLD